MTKPNFKVPEFKVTGKNAYEIRTEVLGFAKDFLVKDFEAKFNSFEVTKKVDPATGELVTSVSLPEFPGVDKLLETAQKMYDFVQNPKSDNKN